MHVGPYVVVRSWIARSVAERGRRAQRATSGIATLASHLAVLSIGLALATPDIVALQRPKAPTAAARQAPSLSGMEAFPLQTQDRLERLAADRAQGDPQLSPSDANDAAAGAVAAAGPSPSEEAGPPGYAPPPPGTGGEGTAAIHAAFDGSPGLAWALRVAYCESRYNPRAVNASSGATGLFQFMPATWNGYFAGWDIWDPAVQAKAARIFYDRGWTYLWVCK